jgi:hypothetical protein
MLLRIPLSALHWDLCTIDGGDSIACGSGDDNIPGRVDSGTTVHVLLPTTEQELRVSHGPKRKLMLEEVLGKISVLAPPIPPRDALYFHHICGLSKEGKNLHSLSESRDAPGGALQSMFGAMNTRHAYSVKNVSEIAVVDLIY